MKGEEPRRAFYAVLEDAFAESLRCKRQVLEGQRDIVIDMAHCLADALMAGRKLLFFGNGGSAADCQHLAAEFVNRFQGDRPPLAALALTVDTSVLTSIGNDFSFDRIFLRQLQALAVPGDVAVGISTSGRSPNVLQALEWGRGNGLHTLGWTGPAPAALDGHCEHVLHVPTTTTARIQEVHILVGHLLCQLVERILFGRGESS